MEMLGTGRSVSAGNDVIQQMIHFDYVGTYPQEQHSAHLPSGSAASRFHTYALEWQPDVLRWYIDGNLTDERTIATTPWLAAAFSRRFLMRMNLAVGGTWPGPPDEATAFPAQLAVDYVRVFR